MADVRDDIRRFLVRSLSIAFDDPATLPQAAAEYLGDEIDEAEARRIAEELLPELKTDRDRAMRDWPAKTDCDRLDSAFEELNAVGIMARHHWTCCNTCGRAAIPDEFARLCGFWGLTPIIGYTFYHVQSSENATDGDGIWLNYGTTTVADTEEQEVERSLAVARRVCDVLRKHGLQTSWDGTIERKIGVDIDWKRRSRPARFFEGDESTGPEIVKKRGWWSGFW
jgi:hypothetical protein